MAGADNIVFNTRERPLSTDHNNLQSMIDRVLADYLFRQESLRVDGTSIHASRMSVPGGLVTTPSGNDVSVSTGVLLQDSATLTPVPGALDSSYRIGINRAATVITMPAPGGTTFYLIEAQVFEVTTTTESRDVLDPTTGNFVPTNVPKQRERRIQFQTLTGTTEAPVPSGGNWVPIAIVRRPGGGGAVVATDIYDARPLMTGGQAAPFWPTVESGGRLISTNASNIVTCDARIQGPGGRRVLAVSPGAFDPTAAATVSPAVGALVANTWYYLYLSPWPAATFQAINPTWGVAGSLIKQGVPVLSLVTPDDYRKNTALITLPAPFNVVPCPVGDAYLVCALRRNAANTGWTYSQSFDLKEFSYVGGDVNPSLLATLAPPVLGVNAVVPAANTVPAGVRQYEVSVRWVGAAGAPSLNTVQARIAAGTAHWESDIVVGDSVLTQRHTLLVPVAAFASINWDFDVATGAAPNAGTAATLRLSRFWY